MRILWFTWKDKKHPFAGGAESVDEKIAKKLVQEGHTLIMISGGYPNCKRKETVDGYTSIRVGNEYTVYFEAYKYYVQNLIGWADIIIEEVNTIPFLTQLYTKEKRKLLIYQLCRSVWFYQLPFPLSIIGYLIEPIYLWIMRNNFVITESESTKEDLQRYGFKKSRISTFPIAIDISPLKHITDKKTFKDFTILSLGSIRSMKQTLDQVKAFELAKKEIPSLKMKIAGTVVGEYGKKVVKYIHESTYKNDIEFLNRVSLEQKQELMKKSNIILVTSVKEGWGLIVTEAASQGTPAIVYDVDGLRDSVLDEKTGIITKQNNPEELANGIIHLFKNPDLYTEMQQNCLQLSREYTAMNSYNNFKKLLFK